MTHSRSFPFVFLLLLPILGVGSASAAEPPTEQVIGDRVWISPLTAHAWRIRTVSALAGFGEVESNALLVAGPKQAILVDTPATDAQTRSVFRYARDRLRRPVRHVIATHWHEDRMGGLRAAHAEGATSYALGKTIVEAKARGLPIPRHELRPSDRRTRAGVPFEAYFPGHGHTADNIVVWFPKEKILHGACFLKAADATSLGNVREADPVAWKKGLAEVIRRFGSAAIVVPGHGAPGDSGLLSHMETLLSASQPPVRQP